ncbi:transmembrane protein 120 [Marchantia polymorpha subsp. ruderalis]|nr:hypothetical protein MARPO_0153s0034 [Marchantia polymorpha]BBM98578.1 hypothetical protein Mp_1g14550 [Marchantia polymorpha subsp. ruderalis]PTQ28870.1 hypothetical protein MARPO_0153s0034 [Marchantia polymorpha]PTQ28871.1 hypothetical protein MARPO_0153s0034 [Marchantia polymorpha]BBM98579.1 hypothetical protein Mp_1g14550 [Marchantia polymorpha subsp. ruderalis]|eukprot:PTQ28869.1 hypothetical protein MARPO_0153s0034 [Marchantia polymorpha]
MNESDNRNNGSIHGNRDPKEDEDRGDVGREAAEKVAGLLERCKALQDAANTHSARIKYDSQILSQQATSVVADIKNVRSFINSAQDEINPRLAEKLEEDLFRARSMVYEGDAASLLPAKPNGYFLSTLLGPVNVRAPRNDVRLKVKEEYNSYRDRTAILFLAFPVILLALKNWCWNGCFPALPVQLYQAWLLFFYTSLALRENILRVNGSDIRPWWVYHHYCAMVMALVSLTWGLQGHPSCIRKQQGVRLFLAWAVMQGIAMLLQNRYQRQRLYTRIALGKAGRMDVVWGETSGVKGQIWVLYPLLFLLQIFQFSIGALLLRTSITEDESEWQMVACGLLLLIMAVGNFSNTVATVVAKAKIKAKMKQTKHMIQRMSSPGLVKKSS